ncbi:MAG TPA: glycosyltransferase family 39 protein, partial [Desulfatiglandales bacterium]|nr:glycosyltransferase family 39 protein [Desulfatiglandales bacterium]
MKIFGHNKAYSKETFWSWAVILIIVCVTACIRIHLLQVPLERDEGEYAYIGQLLLQGIPPFAEAYSMKMPGIYAAYAVILTIFGKTHVGIHLGLMFINLASIILLFLLGRKLFDSFTGIVSAGSFAILSLNPEVQGFFAHAEHYVIVFALAGILLLIYAIEYERVILYLLSGLLLGMAFMMKQHGAAFILFCASYLLYFQIIRRPIEWSVSASRLLAFSFGVLIPFGFTCLALWWAGTFEKFWFWTFTYAREYVSTVPLSIGLILFKKQLFRIANLSILLCGITGIGFFALLWDKKARSHGFFVISFLLFSFLSLCPGLYFRAHYFVLLLPSVSLLAGIAVSSMGRVFNSKVFKKLAICLTVIVFCFSIYQLKTFLFQLNPTMISRVEYGPNPFPESLEIARYIKKHSSQNDRIAVIGSEPQIYFYSDRRAATKYIYTYMLVEEHKYALGMQQEMIREIESAKPKFLIYVNISLSWLMRPNAEKLILNWFEEYQQAYYDLVGIIDLVSPETTVYRWDEDIRGYKPSS